MSTDYYYAFSIWKGGFYSVYGFQCISGIKCYYNAIDQYNLEQHLIEDVQNNLFTLKNFKKFENLDELLQCALITEDWSISGTNIFKVSIENKTVQLIGLCKDILLNYVISQYPSEFIDNIFGKYLFLITDNPYYKINNFTKTVLQKYFELMLNENKQLKTNIEELRVALDYHPDGRKAKQLKTHFIGLLQNRVTE